MSKITIKDLYLIFGNDKQHALRMLKEGFFAHPQRVMISPTRQNQKMQTSLSGRERYL